MIFGQGFLPLSLQKSISNCWAAVLVLVHPGYFISPVPTISGERSPIRHLGRCTCNKQIQRHEVTRTQTDTRMRTWHSRGREASKVGDIRLENRWWRAPWWGARGGRGARRPTKLGNMQDKQVDKL